MYARAAAYTEQSANLHGRLSGFLEEQQRQR
jgi:hypothetical protein